VEMTIMMDQGNALCRCLDKLYVRTFAGIGGASVQERAGSTINEVLEKMPSTLIVPDSALIKSDEISPYVRLLQQEVTILNRLLNTMRTSMSELRRCLLGELQISSDMEQIMTALADDKSLEPGRRYRIRRFAGSEHGSRTLVIAHSISGNGTRSPTCRCPR